MKDFGAKFRLIILPFLIISVGTVFVYSIVHWWLFIQNETFAVDEAILNFAAPIVISFLPAIIWMLPRLKLLDFTGKKIRNPLTGYFFLAWIAITAPAIIAQEYLISATGKLTALRSVSQISNQPKTKYYTVKNVFADKEQTRSYTRLNTIGKYKDQYNMAIYMPCPLYDAGIAKTKPEAREPLVWIGIKYQKTISNRLSEEEKTRAFEAFAKQSEIDFDNRDLTTFTYLDRIGPNRELSFFADAITFSGVNDAPFIVLVPRWSRFEDRNGDKDLWLIGSLLFGALLFTITVSLIPLKAEPVNDGDTKYVFETYKLER
ncbi:MAG: hypothetical protein V4619_11675 [Bacteroidota bacterium]